MVLRAVGLGCTFLNAPALTNDAGTGCYGDGSTSSFTGVTTSSYWSQTSFDVVPGAAAQGNLLSGTVVASAPKVNTFLPWPVRSGRR
jgi:hypothetical protein